MQIQKIIPFRSKKYRAFVASHQCCVCGKDDGTIVAHHENPAYHSVMGGKVSDIHCVPMCFNHHNERHSSKWSAPIWLDFNDVKYAILNEWMETNEKV